MFNERPDPLSEDNAKIILNHLKRFKVVGIYKVLKKAGIKDDNIASIVILPQGNGSLDEAINMAREAGAKAVYSLESQLREDNRFQTYESQFYYILNHK